MPVPIFLNNEKAEPQYETIEKDELTEKDTIIETIVEPAKTEEKENENGEKETVETEPAKEKYKILKRPVALNDTTPLWSKHPNECTDEEYRDFYRKVFHDYKEPLFWIHLNMDYPFNLKVSCTSRRSTPSTIPSREPSSCTTTRYLLPTTSKKSFRNT